VVDHLAESWKSLRFREYAELDTEDEPEADTELEAEKGMMQKR
jgi:hypothetical protein